MRNKTETTTAGARTQAIGDTEEYRLGHHDAKMEAQAQIELLQSQCDELLAVLRWIVGDDDSDEPCMVAARSLIATVERNKP